MSDKWLSEDELKNIIGEQGSESDTTSLTSELLAGLLEEEEGEETYPKEEVYAKKVHLEEFDDTLFEKGEKATLDLLFDIPLEIRVLLGSVELEVENILDLQVGSTVKLDKLAGEPVEVYIGELLIAKGETVILDDKFGVLITEIVTPKERIKIVESKLKKTRQ